MATTTRICAVIWIIPRSRANRRNRLVQSSDSALLSSVVELIGNGYGNGAASQQYFTSYTYAGTMPATAPGWGSLGTAAYSIYVTYN